MNASIAALNFPPTFWVAPSALGSGLLVTMRFFKPLGVARDAIAIAKSKLGGLANDLDWMRAHVVENGERYEVLIPEKSTMARS